MRGRLKTLTMTTAGIAVIVLLAVLAGPTYHKHRHECVLCRLVRNDWRGPFGGESSDFEENECSKWYQQTIEEVHEHQWQGSSSMQITNYWGTPMGAGDSDKPFGILRLSPEQQIELYRKIEDPTEASTLFLAMRNNAETRDEERWQIVRQQTRILQDWIASDFKSPWPEIRAQLNSH